MNLHEYQAKQVFKQYGLPVPNGVVIRSADEVATEISELSTKTTVVKAQVHAGGRGKAGGVKIVEGRDAIISVAQELLRTNLVTYQTDAKGQPINALLLEDTCDIARELYLGAVIDRSTRRVTFMTSTEGGVDIEKVAAETPEKIVKVVVDPMLGVMLYQCRDLAFALGLQDKQIKQFSKILQGLGRMFVEKDFSLLEINPLVVTSAGDLLCLDAKINIDDNALYRQPELREMWDPSQVDPREIAAKEWDLSYISLDGNIGCMVNGAGLAMATMDLIKLCGGLPANFLDVGGGATKERVTEAFKIILSDQNVCAVLVNIFGGIVRCDLIAEGIIAAVGEVGIRVPVVVRLEGNSAEKGAKLLADSDFNITPAQTFQEAAEKVVQMAGESK